MGAACLVVSDGMPLVWMLRAQGHRLAERVYGPGLTRTLCRSAAQHGVSVFLYGGSTSEELQLFITHMREFAPGLEIAGALCPPLLPVTPPFDVEVVRVINDSGARLVFVGLGCPKQENWMLMHLGSLDAITVGVGLAFAQIAGTKPTAPRWMQLAGLEWLFRLAQEPGRLWRRYLVGNSLFVWYCLQDFIKRIDAIRR